MDLDNRLPIEVVNKIVLEACEEAENPATFRRANNHCLKGAQTLNFLAVCSQWRDMIISHYRFWKTVVALNTGATNADDAIEQLEALLGQHPNCDIDVVIVSHSLDAGAARLAESLVLSKMFDMLNEVSFRWRKLIMDGNSLVRLQFLANALHMFQEKRDFCRLEVMKIHWTRAGLFNTGINNFFGGAEFASGSLLPWYIPRLSSIVLENMYPTCLHPRALQSDPRLDVRITAPPIFFNPSWREIVEATIPNTVNYLRVEKYSRVSWAQMGIITPNAPPDANQQIPILRGLDLSVDWEDCVEVLQHVTTRELRRLELRPENRENQTFVELPNPRFDHLTYLKIGFFRPNVAYLLSSCAFPCLREIDLEDWEGGGTNLAWKLKAPLLQRVTLCARGIAPHKYIQGFESPLIKELSVHTPGSNDSFLHDERVTFLAGVEEFCYDYTRASEPYSSEVNSPLARFKCLKKLGLRAMAKRRLLFFDALRDSTVESLPDLAELSIWGARFGDKQFNGLLSAVKHRQSIGKPFEKLVIQGKLSDAQRAALREHVASLLELKKVPDIFPQNI